ncbi:MAG: bifunctional riboflavin kinase/FAD synthetase [Nitrospirae bacterium]|nr:bifunctional riboflavin kinase/FAD synthetase [Nitrospirota bacterium]
MTIIDGIEHIKKKYPYPVLTIGNFDGVHLGHQEIFRMVIERAKKKKGTSVVFTFEPHPLRVIAPERAPSRLTPFKSKAELIKRYGIDVLICANFTKEFAMMTAEDFVHDILWDAVGVKEVFVGENYLFGKGRRGSPELLKELGSEYGFKVTAVPAITYNNIVLSSSKVRSLIAKGKVDEAPLFLGRHYSVEGVVIEGAKRGKALLHIPTANISTSNELLPMDGVYAVKVKLDKKSFGGAANIGFNPTFMQMKPSFEVHIFDFDGEIVGKEIDVEFVKRIRDEKKFSGADELARQMRHDIEEIKAILKNKH